MGILLGRWSVEEFREEFDFPLEAVRVLEEEAQLLYDRANQLVRVDEFILVREEDFVLSGDAAQVDFNLILGWVFESLGRKSTGEMYFREFFNPIASERLEVFVDLSDVAAWKELINESVRKMVREWLDERKEDLSREPETERRSVTLDRLIRNLRSNEKEISGSLEEFF